jgi:hypothetical protein
MNGNISFFDKGIVPDRSDQIVFRDDAAAVLDQKLKDIESAGRHFDQMPVFEDPALRGIQITIAEFIDFHNFDKKLFPVKVRVKTSC